jgi:hypothetical protein
VNVKGDRSGENRTAPPGRRRRGGRMSDRVVQSGDKLHIITRRLFEGDLRRHFVGEVVGASDDLVELRGYTFVFNPGTNEYQKRPELRKRILSLADSGHIVNRIPRDASIDSLEYRTVDHRLVVTDKKGFSLDIHEFGPSR